MNQEKANLDSVVFEAFTHSVDKQYIYLCDVKSNLWRWSQAAVKTFGLSGEYVQDLPLIWMEMVHPDDRERVSRAFGDLFAGITPEHSCEYRVKNANSEYMWVLCRGRLLENTEDDTVLCAGILTDLGQRNKFDPVTGLFSMSQFGITLGSSLLPVDAKGGILLWGLDHFRRVNDDKGYQFGTELLRIYSQHLTSAFPDLTFYRLEGDQFAVISPGADAADISRLFNKITLIGKKGICVNQTIQRFTVSAGAVMYPLDGNQSDELYPKLEYALECAKKQQREQLTFFTNSLHAQSLRTFQLQQSLRKSVQNNCEGFSLVYQPIISSDKHVLTGVEALLRWSDPNFPLTGPAEFIPILESFGDIHKVGKWVLSTALAQVRKWHEIQPNLRVSVNVSYLQMQDSSFKDYVLEQVEALHFPRHLLILELTESCNIIHPKELAQDLNQFRENGIQIALDDFGTGYASLSVLRDLSTDWIKVDQTFVAQIADNDFDKALTEHLISLCNKLGLKVCVEGIETAEILNVIQCFHPDTLQGYYYSRPVDAAAFEAQFLGKQPENWQEA